MAINQSTTQSQLPVSLTTQPLTGSPVAQLFPFFTNQSGFNTGIAIANTGSPASAPAPATGPSINLQALLASIPIAVDGQIIAADYHNSLRAAVIGIADQLGVGLQTGTTTYTFAPVFIPTGSTNPNWIIANFVASRPPTGGNADGWLPVQLPDGKRIQSMTVTGKRGGTTIPSVFHVQLLRQLITAAASDQPVSLITVSLESAPSQFQVSAGVVAATAATGSLSLITAAVAEELKLIDTSNYKYFVQAVLLQSTGSDPAEIDAIQIACSQ